MHGFGPIMCSLDVANSPLLFNSCNLSSGTCAKIRPGRSLLVKRDWHLYFLLCTLMGLRPCHTSVRRLNGLKSSTAAEAIPSCKLRHSFEKENITSSICRRFRKLDSNFHAFSYQCKRPLDSPCEIRSGASVNFGINLFVEEVLPEDVQLPILFSDGVGAHKLKLFLGKLVKLVLHFPDVGLLQLGRRLFGGGLFFGGLSQVRPLPLSKRQNG